MGQLIDQHFGCESHDDADGVLFTLTGGTWAAMADRLGGACPATVQRWSRSSAVSRRARDSGQHVR